VLGLLKMNQKQYEEMELATRFLREIGYANVRPQAGDRPDVVAIIDGKRIGIEVTQFHADEQSGVRGSALRAEEVKKVKGSGERPYGQWGITNPLPGLVARVNEKISDAAAYDKTGYDQLWLLISSQLPKEDALAATFAFAPFVDVTKLNAATHMQLCRSSFSAAHFHLMMSHEVYSWSPSEQWRVTKPPDT
jgi:hypothetical protein